MALSKSMLRGMGLSDEQIQAIIDGHMESVSALQKEVEKAEEGKKDTEKKLSKVQKELDAANGKIEESTTNNPYKTDYDKAKEKYDKLKSEFDDFKASVEAEKVGKAKESVYSKLLGDAGIPQKHIPKILKVTDFSDMELNDDSTEFKNQDDVIKAIGDEWGDFSVTEHQLGATVPTPVNTTVEVPKGRSRAAQIAAQYHANLYGENPKEGN